MTQNHAPCAQEPQPAYRKYPQPEMIEHVRSFHAELVRRRTVRAFDTRPVPLGTDADKPFLEDAPVLIAIFAQRYGVRADGERFSHCHVPESVGIAAGLLIAALHHAGLATLTHTPGPMRFLNKLCRRPSSEKPAFLLVVGDPKPGCRVPAHGGVKKPLGEIVCWLEQA